MDTPRVRLLRGRHVLVVEDHEDTRHLMHVVLENEGAVVTEAEDAEQAFVFAGAGPCDVAITDVSLGRHDRSGVWLLDRFRDSPGLAAVPVVAVTGHKELEAQLNQLGFDAVLIKPVDPLELPERVAHLLAA